MSECEKRRGLRGSLETMGQSGAPLFLSPTHLASLCSLGRGSSRGPWLGMTCVTSRERLEELMSVLGLLLLRFGDLGDCGFWRHSSMWKESCPAMLS